MEQTKRSLSQSMTAPISVESVHEGEDLNSTINRPMFDMLTASLVARIIQAIQDTLTQAGVTKEEVDQVRFEMAPRWPVKEALRLRGLHTLCGAFGVQVILAGGMAANPKVQKTVSTLFEGKQVIVDTFPDEVAAKGAAIEGMMKALHK